jgi:hypothetical protein
MFVRPQPELSTRRHQTDLAIDISALEEIEEGGSGARFRRAHRTDRAK